MRHRPLIPLLIAFIGGVLSGHAWLYDHPRLALPLYLCVSLAILAGLLLPPAARTSCLLLAFFLTGALLYQAKRPDSRLMPFADSRQRVTLEGTVLEPIRVNRGVARIPVQVHALFQGKRALSVDEQIRVTVYNHIPPLCCGDKIRFPARLGLFRNFNNPGRYDYASAMTRRGLTCGAAVSDGRRIVPLGPGQLPLFSALLERIRRPLRALLRKGLHPETAALYRALLLGERQDIHPGQREPFVRSGLAHVLAVSGLHMGLLAGAAFFCARGLLSRFPTLMLRIDVKKAAALLTCVPVVAYALLAGFHIPSQRAMIMVLAFLFSLILGREKEVWSTFALAGLLILALEPPALFSTSFHLSFAAVMGILIITPAVMERLPGWTGSGLTRRLCLYLSGLIIVSVAATLFVLPLVSLYFHRVSLVTVPANVTVIPILGLWIIPLGFLSAVTLPLSGTLAGLLLQLGGWGLKSMTAIIRFWADLPGASIWVPAPNTLEIALLYAILTAVLFHRRSLWIKRGVFVLCLILLFDIGYWTHRVRFNPDLRITYLDVGQGNAALVEFPGGKKMLIDGGGFPGDHFDVGKGVVAPFLWHSKISQIHYLVLSHPQADHMNGLRFIAKAFDPEEFWHNGEEVSTATYRELMDIVASRQIRQCLPKGLAEGREFNGARVDLLHPLPGVAPKRPSDRPGDLNNGSLVLKIAYAGRSFLFPGDLEKEGEATLVSSAGQALQCHVLLSPHHGSRNSNSSSFLRKARPRICVISSRGDHFFGFPHPETLERLHRIGCRVIRIDQCGAVQCRVTPGRFEITTFLEDRVL